VRRKIERSGRGGVLDVANWLRSLKERESAFSFLWENGHGVNVNSGKARSLYREGKGKIRTIDVGSK